MILRTDALTKAFGRLLAVAKVGLEVEGGEVRAIIGPNGAGKTTLFNLISGHLRPDSGRILFKAEEITRWPPHLICRKGLGRSFQKSNIFPRLTTFENVQVAVLSRKGRSLDIFSPCKSLDNEETFEILRSVGLDEQAASVSTALSHGDQRKLEIGIALASNPELLLLDEPTAGLAPRERFEITELIRRIARERQLTVLFTEHDMDIVFAISDRITVMHQGSIIAEGRPEEIRRNSEVQRVYLGGE